MFDTVLTIGTPDVAQSIGSGSSRRALLEARRYDSFLQSTEIVPLVSDRPGIFLRPVRRRGRPLRVDDRRLFVFRLGGESFPFDAAHIAPALRTLMSNGELGQVWLLEADQIVG